MSTNTPRPAATSIPPRAAEARPILTVVGATKRFGANEVLRKVTLAIMPGEIHAICGENGAGKSTLVKILAGLYRADDGRVTIDGAAAEIRGPQEAQALGIALVAQELSLAPALTVLDNIWLGNRTVPFFHRRRALRERARRALAQVGLSELPLDAPVARLGIGQRQLVEIARMLTREARVLILDEPTATLSDAEIERIFAALRALKAEGKAIVYITHRLGEIFEICDRVTVLRNGELAATRLTGEVDRAGLMALMLGRSIGAMYPDWPHAAGAPALRLRGLRIPGVVRDFAFEGSWGAITCLAGQLGSGALETLRALAGLVPDATGEVEIEGRRVALRSVSRAQAAGVQFISEDRAGDGIFLRLRVDENLVATRLIEHTRWGVLARGRLHATARRLAGAVGVDGRRLRSPALELSGGNQQKLAFGRAVGRSAPGIILMNEPTRGVDVGARAEIYRTMRELCAQGHALVMSSSDLEEVIGMADAIVTMYRGGAVRRYTRAEASMQKVLADITHPAGAA
jgi:ribose transport system ATP-binding protein/rhamnose transport system ATP-binding protein